MGRWAMGYEGNLCEQKKVFMFSIQEILYMRLG